MSFEESAPFTTLTTMPQQLCPTFKELNHAGRLQNHAARSENGAA